ncbi:hypothetical protein [Hymenobacter terricola]|uniref:hypothetical protein n=1 Tax=Hymenobacter terricola TaxID=2819236 RepID=UPI001B300F48|nr:hypothetical protein [Hymenobacter terricola]
MHFAKLFDFPHGQLLVEKRDSYTPLEGFGWCIDTKTMLPTGVAAHTYEDWPTEQLRDDAFECFTEEVAGLFYAQRCLFLANKFPLIIRPDGSAVA